MRSSTVPPRPRRSFAAVAILVLLAALAFAPGAIAGVSETSERYGGARLVTAIDAGHTTATVDAYRRSGLARRLHPLPVAVVAVDLLVAAGVLRTRYASPGAVSPSTSLWRRAWENRGPPHLLAV